MASFVKPSGHRQLKNRRFFEHFFLAIFHFFLSFSTFSFLLSFSSLSLLFLNYFPSLHINLTTTTIFAYPANCDAQTAHLLIHSHPHQPSSLRFFFSPSLTSPRLYSLLLSHSYSLNFVTPNSQTVYPHTLFCTFTSLHHTLTTTSTWGFKKTTHRCRRQAHRRGSGGA